MFQQQAIANQHAVTGSKFDEISISLTARYAEDRLANARRQGIKRYVILAAGLDTFAWRQRDDKIEVVEIDHPATQAWKRDLVTRSKLETPDDVSFLPINFESQTLGDVWPEGRGADFISWLGTTYYLSSAALTDTLSTLAKATKPGTQLVLDFWGKARLSDAGTPLLLGTRLSVALMREPMHSFFDVDEFHALAKATGWCVKEIVGPAEQNLRYLANRNDRLKVPSFTFLAHLENVAAS